METIILQVVVGVIGLVSLWLREYAKKDRTYDNAQRLRNAVVDGDLPDLQSTVDELLVESPSSSGSVPSTADAQRRLDAL